mmetsp:Transcript_101544/g.201680  ORF Transcript_101544/g.201680 Transcript_101544/m.201680 type:complete len:286 (+) Transcript_101544:93-950(+)
MCRCMLRCSLPLPLLWFMLSTRTSGCGILNGIQTDAFSEILSVGINIETLKNETQAGLTSQASFVVDMERRFSGDCVGNANNLKCGAAPILVQARTLLQSKMFFDHGNHDVDEENVGLPGIANKKTPRVLAWSPSPNLNQLATYVDTAAKLAHQRLGVHWWAWLPLAIGAFLFCFSTSTKVMAFHTQRMEVHAAQAANAGRHIYERRTWPLKHSHPPSLSLLTSRSMPLPPLPPHSAQAASAGKLTYERRFPAPFSQLTSHSVPLSQSEQSPKSSSSIVMQKAGL